jgi:hypothetical protein
MKVKKRCLWNLLNHLVQKVKKCEIIDITFPEEQIQGLLGGFVVEDERG